MTKTALGIVSLVSESALLAVYAVRLVHADIVCVQSTKAGFTLRTQIYGAYADHFAHLGRVFSATNADLRRRDRSGAECKHSYNTPSFTRGCWIVIG